MVIILRNKKTNEIVDTFVYGEYTGGNNRLPQSDLLELEKEVAQYGCKIECVRPVRTATIHGLKAMVVCAAQSDFKTQGDD